MCDLGRHVSSINHCLLLPVPCPSLELLGRFSTCSGALDGSLPLGEHALSVRVGQGGRAGFCPVPSPPLMSFLRENNLDKLLSCCVPCAGEHGSLRTPGLLSNPTDNGLSL